MANVASNIGFFYVTKRHSSYCVLVGCRSLNPLREYYQVYPYAKSIGHYLGNQDIAAPISQRRPHHWPRARPQHRTLRRPPTKRSLTAALAVHAWPSGRCVAAVRAHRAPIGGSCLSPDGTHVFTLAQAECVVKMWEVWGVREPVKKPSLLEQYAIR